MPPSFQSCSNNRKVKPPTEIAKVKWPNTRLAEPGRRPAGYSTSKLLNERQPDDKQQPKWEPIVGEVKHIRAERMVGNRLEWEITDASGEYIWALSTSFTVSHEVLEEWDTVTLPAIKAAEAEKMKKKVMEMQVSASPNEQSPDELSEDEQSPEELSANEQSPEELSGDEQSPEEQSADEHSQEELSSDEQSSNASSNESPFERTNRRQPKISYEEAIKESPLLIDNPKIEKIWLETSWNGHATFLCSDVRDRMVVVLKRWLIKKYGMLWTEYLFENFKPKPDPNEPQPGPSGLQAPSTSSSLAALE